jgi:hypothetical protein
MDFIDAELVSIYSNSVKHFMEIDVCHILLKNEKYNEIRLQIIFKIICCKKIASYLMES